MPELTFRPMTLADVPAVYALQQEYAARFPGATVVMAEAYLSPSFHGGADVQCAFLGDQLVGYAPLFLQLVEESSAGLPHIAWVEVKALPDLPDSDAVKDALLQRVFARLTERMCHMPPRPVRMTFEYHLTEDPAAAFVQMRGFAYLESVFHMRRDLNEPIPQPRVDPAIAVRRWRMESEAEQRAYVTARSACFPEAPVALTDWQYYMRSPMWSVGTLIAAFAGEELVGGVNVYWMEEDNAAAPVPHGFTEDIFVLPAWRGKGVARAMIAEGMRYLKEHGIGEARLAVRAENEQALPLYRGLGFTVQSESRFYARTLLAA